MLIRVESGHSYKATSFPKVSGVHRIQLANAHCLPAGVTTLQGQVQHCWGEKTTSFGICFWLF